MKLYYGLNMPTVYMLALFVSHQLFASVANLWSGKLCGPFNIARMSAHLDSYL
jgi:hypothetical protein